MESLNGINSVVLIFVSLCVFAIAYRFYGLFIAKKVLRIDPKRPVPSETMADGIDHVKTNKFVLFGHHFAAIAGAGPLIGPVLAAQYGYLPGALWILIGSVLAGGVHDMIVLFASVRHKAESLAWTAYSEVGKTAGKVASVAFLFILILTLAGTSIAMTNALNNSAWGTFVVASTIPTAIIMGLIMKKETPRSILIASIIGVTALLSAIYFGHNVADSNLLAPIFTLNRNQMSLVILIYAMIASILPVWLLLVPRDYLSTYLKIVTIAGLAVGLIIIHPKLQMPAISSFIHGGPVVPGSVFPFLFITIACGAVSGFHSTIAAGTTPKMIASERDIPFVGYGAMLFEGFVAIMALIAACVLVPGDYFAINTNVDEFSKLGMHTFDLPWLSSRIEETLVGRPGGAVSLAVGMAYVFSSLPLMDKLMAYWFHFAIMFEAVFILTLIDAGTRAGRFQLQEMLGRIYPRFKDRNWIPGVLLTGLVFTSMWGYLLYTGSIANIWPLFGVSNQLLAATALIIATIMLVRMDRKKYALITAIPGIILGAITVYAGYDNIMVNYVPKSNYLLIAISVLIIAMILIIIASAFFKWNKLKKIKTTVKDRWGNDVLEIAGDERN